MKNTQKIIALGVFCLSIFGLSPLAKANFTDLAFGHKNAQAIEFLQETGVVNGYADGTFQPENQINRAELAKILVESQGITPDPEVYKNCFTDVAEEWFAPYVCYAKEVGWVSGYADGSYKPEQAVTRVEAIKMTINSQGFDDETDSCDEELFADTDEDEWYGKYLCVALKKGLLEEDENGNYVPAGEITRAQVSENIYRSIAVRTLNRAAYSGEVADMVDEAKEAFQTEKEAIKSEIEDFKAELKELRDGGATAEEIKAEREDFWEQVKEAQQDNREEFQTKIEEAHDLFKEEKDGIKTKRQECRDDGMRYNLRTKECEADDSNDDEVDNENNDESEIEDEDESNDDSDDQNDSEDEDETESES